MDLQIRLYTLICGKHVGTDHYGNNYYESKLPARFFGRPNRWVRYNGQAEASKVPAGWFNWLHFQSNQPPITNKRFKWEREHTPNLTGTKNAYLPVGAKAGKYKRNPISADYEAWRP
jgi:NADH:ubiquinone oxidoreductase subunit